MDLDSLNTLLNRYVTATERVPKTIEEMVKLKIIPRVPPAPAGQKYVIDPRKIEIRLVNK